MLLAMREWCTAAGGISVLSMTSTDDNILQKHNGLKSSAHFMQVQCYSKLNFFELLTHLCFISLDGCRWERLRSDCEEQNATEVCASAADACCEQACIIQWLNAVKKICLTLEDGLRPQAQFSLNTARMHSLI